MTNPVASLAALLQQYDKNAHGGYEHQAQWLVEQGVTIVHWGDGLPPEAPRCSSHLWGVSCGHTSCPLHGPWEAKWAGRGPSAERDEDFKRMLARGRPEGPSAPPQKISEPTIEELISLGECAVGGYFDFPAAKAWFAKWLAGRAAVLPPGEGPDA